MLSVSKVSILSSAVGWECGNLTVFGEISKGRWEGRESVVLLFLAFHRPVISVPWVRLNLQVEDELIVDSYRIRRSESWQKIPAIDRRRSTPVQWVRSVRFR